MIQRIKEYMLSMPNVTMKLDAHGDTEFFYNDKKAFVRITEVNAQTTILFRMSQPYTDAENFQHVIIRHFSWYSLPISKQMEWETYRNAIVQAYQFIQQMVIRKNRVRYAATIGLFDGVHEGHRYLLRQLVESAAARALRTVAITFDCAPKSILYPDLATPPLLSLKDKINQVYETGVDEVYVLHVTTEFLRMSALTFMREFLVKQLNVGMLILGHDHVFGRDRPQSRKYYEEIGAHFGIMVLHCQPFYIYDTRVSSSKIRQLLLAGQMEDAARLLGHAYRIHGKVVAGNQLGRTYGFPTANIQLTEKLLLPKDGVYASYALHHGVRYKAMLNIGNCPTVYKRDKTIEVYIFDFDEVIYGDELTIELLHYLREEIQFKSLDELSVQLQEDYQQTREVLS